MKCILDAWQAHHPELLRFVAARVPDSQEAHDLVQEVFLRATRLDQGLCGVENRRAWLFQVARNLLIDRYRTARDEIPLEDEPALADVADDLAPVEALSQCLPRVLSELSPEDREAVSLCDLGGMTQASFAELKGLSLPGAKSRVQRARQRLREQMSAACQLKFDGAGQVCCFVPRPPIG